MKIFCIGDTHFPYHNTRAIGEALYAIKQEKPTHIVQVGDLYDQYSFSGFTKRNIEMPEVEVKRGSEVAKELWSKVSFSCPKSKRYQLLGNHDLRLIKRAQEKLPEAQTLVKEKVLELYRFKGVKTIEDDRELLQIGGISFHHGYLSKLGDHMRSFGTSAVVGHSHVGGCVYEQRNKRTLFELNCGYLADESTEPLMYSPARTSKWTLGFGLVSFVNNKPRPQFIPL